MSLKGTLGSFSIADIFQLIGHQQKSGVLFVRAPQQEARFFFSDGKIFLGTLTGQRRDLLLGSLLLRGEVVTKAQLEEAVLKQKTNPKTLGEILVQSKAIDLQVLKDFLALQLDEILTEVILWTVGSYEFVPEKISFNSHIYASRSTEGLLMECFRRTDEWPMIIQKVPTTEAIYKIVADDTSMAEAKLEEAEKSLLPWIAQGKTLKEISVLSRLGTFETCRATALLLDKGFVTLSGQTTVFEASSDEIGARFDYRHPLVFFALGICLAYLWANSRSPLHQRHHPGAAKVGRSVTLDFSPLEISRSVEKDTLHEAIDRYLLSQGKMPQQVSDLGIDSPTLTLQEEGGSLRLAPKVSRD